VVDGGILEGSEGYRGVEGAWLGEAKTEAWSRSSIMSSSGEEARPEWLWAAVSFRKWCWRRSSTK
jgi:hypothetical protein